MGTTLTNGIYLPNEGEKNCYAGLKTNWETLDQKIADIAALQQAVAGALHREIVESLPTTDIDPNTIYMILSGTSATENVYDEYMYVNNAWELIGTSATDLTNYYTKGDVDGLLLLKANASDLTSHTGDTTIHVTSADKSKWNTVALIKQLRLVNTQVGSATTIAFTNIDDTNGIKVGDKCMDLDAKMFEITAVDTTNETVTVGSALIDLALDANVVHTSGNETISGDKVFNTRLIKNIDVVLGTAPSTGKFSNIDIADNNKASLLQILGGVYDTGNSYARFFIQNKTADDGTGLSPTGTLRTCGFNINLPATSTSEGQGSITPRANKATDFGLLSYQWRNVWCEKLFLNGTQLDPSAFALDNAVVHLFGNETVDGVKTITGSSLDFKSTSAEYGVSAGDSSVIFRDKNNRQTFKIYSRVFYSGIDNNLVSFFLTQKVDNTYYTSNGIQLLANTGNKDVILRPILANSNADGLSVSLGSSDRRWSKIYGTEYYYGSNNVEFSTKFVTTDTNQTISGNKTFSSNVNVYNSDSSTDTANIILKNSKAERGSTTNIGEQTISFLDKDNAQIGNIKCEVDSNGYSNISIQCSDINDSSSGVQVRKTATGIVFRPTSDNQCWLGQSGRRWYNTFTSKINGVEPSSLSLPDLSNGIDISSYITDLTGSPNVYSAPANGYIVLRSTTANVLGIVENTTGMGSYSRGTNQVLAVNLPVVKNSSISIYAICSSLTQAKFIPCQGNV